MTTLRPCGLTAAIFHVHMALHYSQRPLRPILKLFASTGATTFSFATTQQ